NNLLSLDPAAATGNDVVEIVAHLYDFLVELDPDNTANVLPGQAQRWEVEADGRAIVIHRRDGVKFQYGNPLKAYDVDWSLHRVLKLNMALASAWKSYGFTADNVEALVTAPDEATVRIALAQPMDPKLVIYTLGTSVSAAVLDRKTVIQHERNGDMGHRWLKTRAAGSGAFTLDEWRAKDVLLMSRFDAYWRGPANFKRVVM